MCERVCVRQQKDGSILYGNEGPTQPIQLHKPDNQLADVLKVRNDLCTVKESGIAQLLPRGEMQ